jgi:hypothetical protein
MGVRLPALPVLRTPARHGPTATLAPLARRYQLQGQGPYQARLAAAVPSHRRVS